MAIERLKMSQRDSEITGTAIFWKYCDYESIDENREIVKSILDEYKDYPSILATVQDPEHTFEFFSFNEVTATDVWLQLTMLDASKSTGVDQIPQNFFLWLAMIWLFLLPTPSITAFEISFFRGTQKLLLSAL